MERERPDRSRGYATTFKVGVLVTLSFSFTRIAWNYVEEVYYARPGSKIFYGFLTIVCTLLNVVGAILANSMS